MKLARSDLPGKPKMRSFHLVTSDSRRHDLQVMTSYEKNQFFFDSNAIQDGHYLSQGIPPGIKLFISKGGVADFMANPLSWPIVSDRLLGLIKNFSQDFQVFDAPFFDKETGTPVGGLQDYQRDASAYNDRSRIIDHNEVEFVGQTGSSNFS
jgi:hypothetical protein